MVLTARAGKLSEDGDTEADDGATGTTTAACTPTLAKVPRLVPVTERLGSAALLVGAKTKVRRQGISPEAQEPLMGTRPL